MINRQTFGTTKKGSEVTKFVLTNSHGFEVHLLSYGLTIQKILYPTSSSKKQDIVLGFDTLEGYESNVYYFGSIVGRNANRLSNGSILIDGQEIKVTQNEGVKQLHGGFDGFDKKNWDCTIEDNTLICMYISPDLEEGFPGEVITTVTFELTEKNELKIETIATTDQDTVVNLTRHDYFNLKDGGLTDTKSHLIQVKGDSYTPTDEENIVTGEILPVDQTPFNLTRLTNLGDRLEENKQTLPMGFDINYVTNPKQILKSVAKTIDPESGRALEIFSTQPGVQFYTAAYVTDVKGKNDSLYQPYHGFCLETQHLPDDTKHDNFSNSIITEEIPYTQNLIYKFTS